MSDEPEERTPSASFLHLIMRKVGFALLILFVVYALSTRYLAPSTLPRSMQPVAKDTAKKKEQPPVNEVKTVEPKAEAAPVVREVIKENSEEVLQLRSRIEQLETRLKGIEETAAQKPAAVAGETPAVAPAVDNERVAQLEARATADKEQVAKLEAQAAADKEHVTKLEEEIKKDRETLAEVKTQLGEIQVIKTHVSNVQSHASRQLSALTVFGALKDSVAHGEPAAVALDQIGKLTEGASANKAKIDELLAKLKPLVEKGAVTLPSLHNQFTAALPLVLSPEQKTSAWSRSMQSLIRIRKVGQQSGTDDESVMARAEALMEHEDVEGAVKEMATLSPEGAKGAEPWVAKAKAFLDTRNLMDELQVALAQDTPPPPPPAPAAPAPEKAAPEKEVPDVEAAPDLKPAAAPAPVEPAPATPTAPHE